MIFRRIILSAIFVGLIAGSVLSVIQALSVSPIIFAAEVYEIAEPVASSHSHGHESEGGHHHDADAWSPEDGNERTSFSIMANILASIGFASILIALMAQLQLQGVTKLNVLKGALWGVAGYIAFFVVPGIGLPPEIPGVEVAALENRQSWWLLAVVSSIIGLAVMAFTPIKYKVLGLVAIALPFIIKAPHIDGPEFSHPDPAAVMALTELHHQFIIASGVANLVFWIVMGLVSAFALNKIVLKGLTSQTDTTGADANNTHASDDEKASA